MRVKPEHSFPSINLWLITAYDRPARVGLVPPFPMPWAGTVYDQEEADRYCLLHFIWEVAMLDDSTGVRGCLNDLLDLLGFIIVIAWPLLLLLLLD